VLVEFVQHEAHTVHQAVHVRRFTLCVPGAAVRCQRRLEHFKVLHPFKGKFMRLNVGLIEDKDKWQLCFV
jgi:hypothetical protein